MKLEIPVARIALVLSVAALAVFGQPAPTRAQTPLSLQDILEKVESHYRGVQAYTAYFKQVTTSAASTINTEANGRLYYQKPRQMRWDYESPEIQSFVVNREVAWLYVPVEHQIALFDANAFFSSPLSRAFFDGMFELKRQFHVTLDQHESSQRSSTLLLTPKQEDPNIQSLRLQIDLKTYQIISVETKDALGNTNHIVLESQKEKASLEPRLFQMEVPAATVVVDADGRELAPSEIEKLQQRLK
jgi:outer membrane lipoprotein carrier protein